MEAPGEAALLEDLRAPGCPACRVSRRTATRSVESLLAEALTDPDARARLRDAHGFCDDHALLTLQRAARAADTQGIAILYRDLLGHLREEAIAAARAPTRPWGRRRRRSRRLDAHRPCSVCEAAEHRVGVYLHLLADADPDSEVGRAARQPDRGVCLPHLRAGLDHVAAGPPAERLLELYLQVDERLRADLDELLRKLDHRFADEPADREKGAWRRAVLWVTGRPAHRVWLPGESP